MEFGLAAPCGFGRAREGLAKAAAGQQQPGPPSHDSDFMTGQMLLVDGGSAMH
jgi:hypothetical protein